MASLAVLDRRARAVELAQDGRSYDDIAMELGYANRSGAWKAVQAALSSRVAESVDELRMLELLRLDAIQASLWAKVEAGDVRAGLAVLRIIEQRSRLLGLVPETGKPDRKPAVPSTVVRDEFWDHVGEFHASDYRVCRCPEIIGDTPEDHIRW